ERQGDGEGGAAAGAVALGGDAAAVQLDELLDQGEADAEAAVLAAGGGVGLAEALGEGGQEVGIDTPAVVAHDQAGLRVGAVERDLDPAPLEGELDGVGQQVPGHLLEARRISRHRGAGRVEAGDDLDLLAVRGRLDRGDGGGDHVRQLYGLHV